MLKVSKIAVGVVVLLCATSAHAVELPGWNIDRICATENAGGQCRIFESQAKRTISGGWAVLPEDYRSACVEEIKEPYASYRSLSQCLELQVLQGRELRELQTATTPTHGTSVSSTPSHGKIETLDDYIKLRDSWGKGKAGSLDTQPIRFAALPSPVTDVPQSFFLDKTDHLASLGSNGSPPVAIKVATFGSLAKFLAERDGWGLILAKAGTSDAPAQESTAQPATPSENSQGAEVPRAEIEKALADLLAERESWGTEPSMSSASPASPSDSSAAIAAPPEDKPVPHLTEVPRAEIEKALADLLAERESWGTEPGSSVTAAPAEPGAPSADSEPVTDLAGYLARRESWGTGDPPKPVNAPLAAGAVSPLPSTTKPAAPESDTPVIVHPAEERPVPQLTEVPRDQIDKALADLLAERESWLAAPDATAQPTDTRSAEATACETGLRETMGKGTVLFESNSATLDATSFATLDQISESAKACENAFIQVEGHTDDLGSDAMNNRLSEQRARAVMNYLVEKGVDSSRIEAIGFGKIRPLVPNTSAENRAKNRRIELRVR